MYRTVTDFHGGWYGWGGLQQAIFIAGNFTSGSQGNLHGANGTWPDIDMLPLQAEWWAATKHAQPEMADRGQTIMTLWTIGKYPLFHSGPLPTDAKTLAYLTNPVAVAVNRDGQNTRVVGYEGNCTCNGGVDSCTIPAMPAHARPCVATWAADVPTVQGRAARESNEAVAYHVAAFINMGENATKVSFSIGSLGLPVGTYAVTDVWSGAAVGQLNGTAVLSVALRHHASALYKVAPRPPPPA